MRKLIGVLACVYGLGASTAFAQDAPHACRTMKEFEALVGAGPMKTEHLTHDQWEFLRGVYAMQPTTPLDFPFGSGADLARFGRAGFVLFTDGALVCTPMEASATVLDLLDRLKAGEVTHEPKGKGSKM